MVHWLDRERFSNMHRLVYMVSMWWLSGHDERGTWAGRAVARLEELVPHGVHERMELWMTYLPHAIYVVRLDVLADKTAKASFLDWIGRLGQYSAAEITHRRVLSFREKRLGEVYYRALASMNEVGVALYSQGKHEEAESMHRQTLLTSEKVLGKEHLNTLTTMNNWALVLGRQGKYEGAELKHRQTLATRKKVLGKKYLYMLTTTYCLASHLADQYHYAESTTLYGRTCAGFKDVLEKDHPTTCACRQHYSRMLASQEWDQLTVPPRMPRSSVNRQMGKGPKL
ncbi:hypothetical protein CC78DRAFT_594093 [Lojkania enalia]|uniref:Kinesin light chain n=1 Tax=Lojkania enalia TaxID=147567 RepID=A0A9P4JXB3_9PLEO|nr:hypothetical protein CC78DRAFT_594093 [Didymosphaeria enalia]